LDHHWTTTRPPLDHHWTTIGPDHQWTTTKPPLGYRYATICPPSDLHWTTIGPPLDHHLTTIGPPLDQTTIVIPIRHQLAYRRKSKPSTGLSPKKQKPACSCYVSINRWIETDTTRYGNTYINRKSPAVPIGWRDRGTRCWQPGYCMRIESYYYIPMCLAMIDCFFSEHP
jgi:hypothetical protein